MASLDQLENQLMLPIYFQHRSYPVQNGAIVN